MSLSYGFQKEVFLFIVVFYQCGGNNGAIVMENKDAIDATIVRHAVITTPTYSAFSKQSSTVANWNVLNPVKQTVSTNGHHRISTEVGMNLQEANHDLPTVSAPDIPPHIENVLRRLFGMTSRADKNESFQAERDLYSVSHISNDRLNDSSKGVQNYSDQGSQNIGVVDHNTSSTLKDEQTQRDIPRYSVDVSEGSEIKGKQDINMGTDKNVSQGRQNEVVKVNPLQSTVVMDNQRMLERKSHVMPTIQTFPANMKPGHVVNRQTTRLPSAGPLFRPRYPSIPQQPMYSYRYPIPMHLYHYRSWPLHTLHQGRFPVVQPQYNPLRTQYPGRYFIYAYFSEYPEYKDIFVQDPRVSGSLQSFSVMNDLLESFT